MDKFDELIDEITSLRYQYYEDGERIRNLSSSNEFYKRRVFLLKKVQKYMKDPERTIVCDILANGTLLPDPKGERYGLDLRAIINE